MPVLLSDVELQALDGLPHLHRCLYIFGIRRYMDYRTGITGIKREISYKSLAEEVYINPRRGVCNTGNNSRDQIKRALITLEKVGLIKRKSIVTKEEKQLILECTLAFTDNSIQNKAAPYPPHSTAPKDAPLDNLENTLKIDVLENEEVISRPKRRPTQNKKAAPHPLSVDKIRYDLRQKYFDLLSQRRFPIAYLSDPRTNAMIEAWDFGNVTEEEAAQAMQHADNKTAAKQERVSRPWYYQDIPFQFRAATDAAKQQTQEIKNDNNTPIPKQSRITHEQRRKRMADWAERKEKELQQEAERPESDLMAL